MSSEEQLALKQGQHLWRSGWKTDDDCVFCGVTTQDPLEDCPASPDLTLDPGEHLWAEIPGADDVCLLCGRDMQESEVPCDRGQVS